VFAIERGTFRGEEYHTRMKTPPEMERFNEALRQVMTVTKPELTAMLHDEDAIASIRQPKGPRPKTSPSGHASGNKG
jgi:hypothetical protein